MMEVLSAVFTGMAHCSRLIPMVGDDLSTPRRLGHFFIVINPEAFVSQQAYDLGMSDYLRDIRSSAAAPGRSVMAPGDREWRCADQRMRDGIPMSLALIAEYQQIADELGISNLDFTS
jgi:LDH2 family malate/lactate/ureidoglycolate dehydrogenase